MVKPKNEDKISIFERTLSKRITIDSENFFIFGLACGEDRTDEDSEEIDVRFEITYEVHDVVALRTKIHEVVHSTDLLELYHLAKNGAAFHPIQIRESPMCDINRLITGSSHPITIYVPLAGELSVSDLIIEFVSSFFSEEYLQETLETSHAKTKSARDIN